MASAESSGSLHKRLGSTAAPPQAKRQAPRASKPEPQYVYIVMVESMLSYGESSSDIHGVYASVQDANNFVKKYAYEEYTQAEEVTRGTNSDGTVFWSSEDVGEGDRAEIRVQIMEVKPVGSEKEREWVDGEDDGEEDDEEQDED
ncbi:uncharacterized protein LY89DRAFT_222426 [Mollisia scopiformis]|uniref:Uncharacterized protein n=1 Tax=Mollisia scopiformis TaxID=149040 RepID=A0A194WVY6_MOLSC|nr:uncharacterized protein LY89DRAFT_222426 [Mollisia scopiformis]KUJ12123.1 hypothetical protein LY89DRAFT_222426 [Mollisia scopiformis]